MHIHNAIYGYYIKNNIINTLLTVLVGHLFNFCVVLLCVFTFLVLCWDVCYFFLKTMFGSYLPPVVCRRVHVVLSFSVYVCV